MTVHELTSEPQLHASEALLHGAAAPPPHVVMFQIMNGMWVSQIASAFAQLGVADFIAAGTRNAEHIAEECAANADALYRLCRAAATIGLCREVGPKEFALTPVGETLRAQVSGSMRDLVIAETAPGHWLPWGRLAESVRRGGPMTQETLGMSAWEYYEKNAEEGQCFARGMGNLSAIASHDVASVYDVGDAKRIVDVGGSEGVLLRGFLGRAPAARGVLFDRPEIIDYARGAIAGSGFADRVELAGGDFFDEVPAGGDLYVLKTILHDWPDADCERILRNIHRAALPGSRLLLVEMLVPDEPQPSPVSLLDINMLVMLGGRERTASEFRAMLSSCGYEVERVLPTPGMFAAIEALRAS